MPKIRRRNLPPALWQHLLDRVEQRDISARQLRLLAEWLDGEPEAPPGAWFKRFPGMTVCGEAEWLKTFLIPGQAPFGEELP